MYRIYDLLPFQASKDNLNPSQINYKTQLTESLTQSFTMVKGRVTHVDYKNHTDDLILDVDVVYTEQPDNAQFPLKRTTTRKWYSHDGSNFNILGFDTSIKDKLYDLSNTIKEGQRRRKNIINSLFASASELGKSVEAASLMKIKAAEILSYEAIGDTTIIDTIQNDTNTWLDESLPTDPTKTFRQVIVDGMTI